MPELEPYLREWRLAAGRSGELSVDEIEELEAHLRDHAEALVARGRTPAESVAMASERLGALGSVETEYRKVRTPGVAGQRLLWMLSGYAVFTGVQLVARAVATVASGTFFALPTRPVPAAIALLTVHLTVAGCLIWVVARVALSRRSVSSPAPAAYGRRRLAGGARLLGTLVAALLLYAGAALTTDYMQWWTTFRVASPTMVLPLTNFGLDFLAAVGAPVLAITAVEFHRRRHGLAVIRQRVG